MHTDVAGRGMAVVALLSLAVTLALLAGCAPKPEPPPPVVLPPPPAAQTSTTAGGPNKQPDYTPISVVPVPKKSAAPSSSVMKPGESVTLDLTVPDQVDPAKVTSLTMEARDALSLKANRTSLELSKAIDTTSDSVDGWIQIGPIMPEADPRRGHVEVTIKPVPAGHEAVHDVVVLAYDETQPKKVYGYAFLVVDARKAGP